MPNNGPASLRQGFAGAPWRLPSGQLLVEYALTACFNGPALLARFPYVAPESAAAVVSEEPDGRMLKSLENLSAALRVVAEGPAAALESPKEKKDPDRRGRRKPAGKQAGGTW